MTVFIVRHQRVPSPSECINNLATVIDVLAMVRAIAGIISLASMSCSGSLTWLNPVPAGVMSQYDMNVSLKLIERSELSNPMRSRVLPSSGLSPCIRYKVTDLILEAYS